MATARILFLLTVIACAVILYDTHAPMGTDYAVAGAPFAVGDEKVKDVTVVGGKALPLDVKTADATVSTRVRLRNSVQIQVTLDDGGTRVQDVHVLGYGWLVAAIGAFLGLAVLGPYAVWPDPLATGTFGPWYQLLSEPGGGYSLSRVQLLLWAVPVAILYGAFSFLTRSYIPVGTQLEVLLGLSGATTILGSAANPPPDSAAPADGKPTLSDLLKDWSGHGDVSRYQYLLLSAFGAVVLVTAFLSNGEFPELPTPFLYLVAASQGTYVVTKVVKQAKAAEATPGDGSMGGSAKSPAGKAPLEQ